MKFLRQKDYEMLINDTDLAVLMGTEVLTRQNAEDHAESEIKSYLRQRYDVDVMMRVVTDYDNAASYATTTRIQWIEPDYDNVASYLVNDLVNYLGNIYINIQNSSGTDPSNNLFWTNIGVYEGIYVRIGTDTAAGNLPNDAAFWTIGDDRDPQIKSYMIDIALYHAHPRISPRVTPDDRIERYKQAIAWLMKVAKGDIQTTFPLKLDADGKDQGDNLTYGSNLKLNHNY